MSASERSASVDSGFTIIEVLIVLVIMVLILLIMFFAVPATQRTRRNTSRKQYLTYLVAQMETYQGSNLIYPGDGVIPGTTDRRCIFYTQNFTSPGACITGAGGCRQTTVSDYTICYHSKNGSHSYIGPLDEFSIELGHICEDDPNTADVIQSAGSLDNDSRKFATWTQLESGPVICLDNGYQ